MANGTGMLNELDFEKKISTLPDRALLEFLARQNYETSCRCVKHSQRITVLEAGARKQSGITGGISGAAMAIIIGIIEYLRRGNN